MPPAQAFPGKHPPRAQAHAVPRAHRTTGHLLFCALDAWDEVGYGKRWSHIWAPPRASWRSPSWEDTGPGIPPALGQRIFEPYVRGPNTGTPGIGLGLATVKRLVESHGGTLGVRAGPTGGALFWFELDEALPAEARQPQGHSSALRRA